MGWQTSELAHWIYSFRDHPALLLHRISILSFAASGSSITEELITACLSD